MEQRTVERFRKRVILIHWLHAASFAVLLVTGAIMLFGVTSISGGQQIRTIHQIAALFFIVVPLLFILLDPRAALNFLSQAIRWERDDLVWLRSSVRYYFGRKVQMPPQGYLNGDQKLWQLIVIVTGLIFGLTGVMMWFFKLKMPLVVYQGVLVAHITSFVIVFLTFTVHFYLTTLQPRFEESLSSMADGRVSSSYAQQHYSKWYKKKTDAEKSSPSV